MGTVQKLQPQGRFPARPKQITLKFAWTYSGQSPGMSAQQARSIDCRGETHLENFGRTA
jgi:hypothetical protein